LGEEKNRINAEIAEDTEFAEKMDVHTEGTLRRRRSGQGEKREEHGGHRKEKSRE